MIGAQSILVALSAATVRGELQQDATDVSWANQISSGITSILFRVYSVFTEADLIQLHSIWATGQVGGCPFAPNDRTEVGGLHDMFWQ